MSGAKRHRWGEKVRFVHKSERECLNRCGVVKVTRHEGPRHWVEFWCDLERIAKAGDPTPPCEPSSEWTAGVVRAPPAMSAGPGRGAVRSGAFGEA